MSARVRLLPSGREFTLLPSETFLEGALRAGLPVNYGCSGGSCGLCRARVAEGVVERLKHQDYVFSEAEKVQGYVLMCSFGAESDVVLEAELAGHPDEIQFQEIVARVRSISPLTDKVRLLHLVTPRSQRLRFLAGQSVALSVGDAAEAYAIASCPCDNRNLQFHIRYVPGNPFAERLFAGAIVPNDPVTVYGPVGDFVLRPPGGRPLLFLAVNSAFAPVKSLIEHALSLEEAPSIDLYWLATVPGGHYAANWCRALADTMEQFHYHELSAPSLIEPQAAEAVAEVARRAGGLDRYDIYVAGPAPFVAGAREELLARGARADRLFTGVA